MLQNFHRNMKRKEAFEKQGFSIAQTLGTGGKVSKNDWPGNYLAVQWVGLHPFTAEGLGSILGWGNKIPQVAQNHQEKQNETKNPKCPSADARITMWYIYSMEYYLTI